LNTDRAERGKALSIIEEKANAEFEAPEKRFPDAIVCHSVKKNLEEHKAILLKEKP
jgi:hypothetical protein